jgi:hypothetical protein
MPPNTWGIWVFLPHTPAKSPKIATIWHACPHQFAGWLEVEVGVDVGVEIPLGTLPLAAGSGRIRNEKCLSEASCLRFPP